MASDWEVECSDEEIDKAFEINLSGKNMNFALKFHQYSEWRILLNNVYSFSFNPSTNTFLFNKEILYTADN